MIGADDGRAFYDLDGFGSACARRRPGEDDLPFVGILGSVDEVALQGHAVSAEHGMRHWTTDVDLDEGDIVLVGIDYERTPEGYAVKVNDQPQFVLVDGQAQGGTVYRVRTEPRRLNDWRETAVLLSSVPT